MASVPRRAPKSSGKPFRRAPLFVLPLEDRTLPAPVVADDNPHGSGCCCAVCGKDFMPQPYSFFVPSGFLTGEQGGDRDTVARNALMAFTGTTGLTPDDVAAAAVSDSYTSQGLSHVYFRQQLRGLPVINSTAGVHLMEDGRAIMVNASLVPNLAATPADPAPVIDPAEAVRRAAAEFGYTLTTPPTVLATEGGSRAAVVISEPEFSDRDIRVQRAFVNTPRGVRPVWELDARTPDGRSWYHAAVDTQDGAVEFWADWVGHFGTYNVLPFPNESPVEGPRQVLVNPADPAASPFGWHDTNGVAGGEFTDTRGNNVNAQEDQDNNNTGGFRPDGGAARIFDFPFNQALPPTGYVPALVTNLFYANNRIHDVTQRYGFDEPSGNFQAKNYTGLGIGGDQVEADAIDGSGTNNANFATPPDGFSGRMQMYRFTLTTPQVTSDFENGIITHEYGHGITNRLTGGPGNSSALSLAQPRSMGEGWSDFFALMFAQRPTDRPGDRYGLGTYVLNQPPTGAGVRGIPYSFDLAVNTMTFSDVGTGAGQVNPAAGQIHAAGARWASALWDMNWILIEKYGYDLDLSTGYAPGGGPASAGNKLTMRLVMDALKLQQVNPTFIQARDAVLMADVALTGGVNQRDIWRAFARRGLGFGATTADANSGDVNESFMLPPEFAAAPGVIAQSPAGATGTQPASLTVTFSEPMDPASFDPLADVSSFTGPGGTNLRPAITTFAWGGGNTTLTINFAPQTAQGQYTLTLGPNITAADNGAAMNQDFDANVGEPIQDRYTARFQYDAAPLTVTAITPAPGGTTPVATTAVDVTFSEDVRALSVSAADLNLSQGTVTGASLIAPNQVRFAVTGFTGTLGEATVYLSLKHGAVTDAAGFASLEFNSSFTLDYDTTAFLPDPLFASNPLGSLVYDGTFPLTTLVGSLTDTDEFTLTLDPGQRVSAIVTPAAGLTPSVTITEAGGSSGALGSAPGAPVAATRSAAAGGTVTVRVGGNGSTTGGYSLRLLLNAAFEDETVFGVPNNSTATAAPLDGLFSGPFAGLTTSSVVGRTETAGQADFYRLSLAAGETVSVGLAGGTAASVVQLLAPNGTTILATGTVAGSYTLALSHLTAAAGTYFVRVVDSAVVNYQMTVVRGAGVDREGNDTLPTAQPIVTSVPVLGGLTAADEDWYRVTVPAGLPTLRIRTSTPGDAAGQFVNVLDPVIEVYDPLDNLVGVNDNGAGDGRNALTLVGNVPAGTYSVRVRSANGLTTGEYVLAADLVPNTPPSGVSAGGPYTVAEGGTLALLGAASDIDGDILTYGWDLNNDGVFTDAVGQNPIVSAATLAALGLDNGPFSGPVFVQVADGRNPPVTSAAGTLTVTNSPPTGTAANDGPAPEGTAAPFTVSVAATDPSSADVTAGFTYSYDFDNDGTFDVVNSPSAAAAIPAALLADGPTTQTVRVVVTDQDGADSAPIFTTITITGVGPTGTLTGGGTVVEGTPGSVTVTGVTDPSLADTAAGFRYAYDFDNDGTFERGDGSYAGSLADNTSVVPPRFLSNGPFSRTVRVRVIDVDGDFTDLTTTIDVVNGNPTARAEGVQAVEGSSPGGFAVLDANDPSADDIAAGFKYSFDFDNDGTFDLGGASYATAVDTNIVSVPAVFVPDGPAVLTVRARVWDQNDGFFDTFADVIVNNVAPQAVFTGSPPVAEGGAATVSFGGQTDPSAADLATLRYAYDFDNDGVWDIGGATYATAATQTSAAVPPQFLTDGPGNTVVRGRVIDQDGGFTDYAVTISVTNTAPTADFAAGGAVPEGSPGQVTFSNPADVSAADVAAGFKYAFDFDNDGVFDLGGITYATAVPDASVAVPGKFTGASGVRVVRGRIFDQDGGFTDYTANLTVTNVAPQATLTGGGPVPEGTIGRVSFTGIIDPSPVDVAGMRFAFDFDNDGTFDLGGMTYASAVASPVADVPAVFLADGPFVRTVRGRVIDPDGGFNDFTTTIQVLNAAPVAGLLNGGPVNEGQPGSVTATAVDSAADLAALRYSFDFDNDGTFEVVDAASPTAAVPAGDSGQRTVRVRITDKDGGSAEATTTIAVGNVAPTGTLGSGGPVAELANGLVSFSSLFDPSAADSAAGFRYSFDFDNDGVFEVADSASPSAAVPAAVLGNGPADRLVRGRVADKDGGFTDYTVLVPVFNAAPVAVLSADPAVPVGQASTVRFTNITDAAADLAAGLMYTFEFTANGATTVVSGANPVGAFTFPAAGTYLVVARITDRDGGTNEDAVTVTVANVGPAGSLVGAATQQGGSASVTFTGVTHPGSAAGAAGFRYAYDFDNDGVFDLGDGTYAGSVTAATAAVPAGLLLDAGTRTVRARAIEVGGGFTDMTTAVTVANVAPTAVVSAPVTPVPAGTPVTISLVNPTDPSPADTAAGFLYSFDTNADGKFEVVNSKTPSVTVTPTVAGTLNVIARITDQNGGSTTKTVTLTAGPPVVPPVPPPATPRVRGFAVGTDAGTTAQAALYDDAGTLLFFGNPLGTEFTGGVRVAAGDVNFDGVPDLAAGTGPGRSSLVRVISGKDGSTLFQTAPFEAAFTGGVYVSLGDIDGDGKAELAVSPDEGGGPRVTVHRSGGMGGVLTDYFGIDDPAFRGGARTAFGDVNKDGKADLSVAAGFGGGPRLSVWDGASLGTPTQKTLFNDFFVFEQTLRNGVFVTAGDIDGDGFADVIAGGGPGGAPRVFALSGQQLLANKQVPVANFFAGDTGNRGGVRVVAADFDNDGRADLLAGSGAGAGSRLTRYSGAAIPAIGQPPAVSDADQFPGFLGGLFVG